MPINITMPALSPTMEEGNLAKWLVKEGDQVSAGDVIAEIETDKATMEVEAVDEGTVAKIVVPEGTEGVKVNALIAILAEEGEDAAEAAKSGGAKAASAEGSAQGASAPAGKVFAREAEGGKAAANGKSAASETGAAATSSPRRGEGGSAQVGPGEETSPSPEARAERAESPHPEARAERASKDRIFSSPLARRIAKEAGIDLARVQGSGPNGRVVRADIEAAIAKGGAKPAPAEKPAAEAPVQAPKPMADEQVLRLFEEGSYEVVPHDNMRKTIARRLVEAKSTIPHFYLTLDCEIDALLSLRKQLNAAAPITRTETGEKPAYKLSVNDMIIKALAMALIAVPDANVTWTDKAMLRHAHADVGVAVSIPGGLITPVVRKADQKTLSAISNEMKDLARRARDRKLKPEEYQGGTTAVSNLGMFGIKDFSAVINPPHATILAVGAGEERAVVKDGAIKIATIMSVTLSTDHRAVDGALGAELLGAFKRYIENPMGMLV